jgi:predicted metal-dependent enzyme (double-stranded beta helix superfamily)
MSRFPLPQNTHAQNQQAQKNQAKNRSARKSRPRHNLVEIATRLAGQHELWEPPVRYDTISRYYARLAHETDFEAWLLTWVPGQGTDWHDHGGSAGAFAVVRGELTERTATVSQVGPPRIVEEPRQLADGSLRAFGTKHIHKVTNNGLEPAVSIHVYSPALVEMNSYAEDGPQLWQTGSQLIGVNW